MGYTHGQCLDLCTNNFFYRKFLRTELWNHDKQNYPSIIGLKVWTLLVCTNQSKTNWRLWHRFYYLPIWTLVIYAYNPFTENETLNITFLFLGLSTSPLGGSNFVGSNNRCTVCNSSFVQPKVSLDVPRVGIKGR